MVFVGLELIENQFVIAKRFSNNLKKITYSSKKIKFIAIKRKKWRQKFIRFGKKYLCLFRL